jgi:hypothetical protein
MGVWARRLAFSRWCALVAVVALFAGASANASPSHTLTVCGSGPLECMYATIAAALDAASDGDLILIAPGTYSGGLTVAKSVVLSGAGQGSTTIAGQGPGDPSDLMTVAVGVRAVLENVTLNDAGRTAIVNHGTLEVRDSGLSSNGTPFSECCDVGGILSNGDLTLERTTLDGNVGFGAGAILSYGMARIFDSTITGNASLFGGGGIVSRDAGRLVLRNSTVTGNGSQGAGGVFGGGASTVIDGTTVSGNGGDLAGGIYGGNLVVRDSVIEGNLGTFGGAGGIAATVGNTQVVGSTIRDNALSTSSRAGGIRNDGGSSMMLVDTLVAGNRAPEEDSQGGGIWNGGSLRVVASEITGNAAGTPEGPGVGGGVYNVGTIFLAATLIADNFPDDCFGCPGAQAGATASASIG